MAELAAKEGRRGWQSSSDVEWQLTLWKVSVMCVSSHVAFALMSKTSPMQQHFPALQPSFVGSSTHALQLMCTQHDICNVIVAFSPSLDFDPGM